MSNKAKCPMFEPCTRFGACEHESFLDCNLYQHSVFKIGEGVKAATARRKPKPNPEGLTYYQLHRAERLAYYYSHKKSTVVLTVKP